jgi:hypothetical protein
MKRLALADLCSALQRGSRPKVSRWDCNEVCPSASCDMPRKHARHLNITRIYGSCSCNLLAIKNVDIFLELQPGDTIHSILMYSLSIIVYSQRQFVNIVNCIISLFDLYIDIRFLVKKHTESASHALTKLGRAASPRRRLLILVQLFCKMSSECKGWWIYEKAHLYSVSQQFWPDSTYTNFMVLLRQKYWCQNCNGHKKAASCKNL